MANEIIEVGADGKVYLTGEYKENMSFQDAIRYLRSYEFGMIGHPDMEVDNFIFIRQNGDLAFFESNGDAIEILGQSELEYFGGNVWSSDWYYLPGYEFAFYKNGIQFWHDIRVQNPSNESSSPKI